MKCYVLPLNKMFHRVAGFQCCFDPASTSRDYGVRLLHAKMHPPPSRHHQLRISGFYRSHVPVPSPSLKCCNKLYPDREICTHISLRMASTPTASTLPNRVAYQYGLEGRRGSILKSQSRFLNQIPLEIRNSIYQLYIEGVGQSRFTDKPLQTDWKLFGLSIIPRLYDPPLLRIDGYGLLPLRQTCRQIYQELAHQVSFNVDTVRIGSYNFEHKEKDPLVHWRTAYSLLESHPGLRLSVTNVIVRMPAMRDEMMRHSQLSVGHVNSNILRQFDEKFAAVVPGLKQCLQKFAILQWLTIIITVEKRQAPDFDPLLGLHDILGKAGTRIKMCPPSAGLRSYDSWVSEWEDAFNICLKNREVEDMSLQAVLLAGAQITKVPKRRQ
jgi:hypothetical protein